MGLEKAVQDFVKRILEDNHYCTKQEVQDIAELVAKEVYEKFCSDVNSIRKDIDDLKDRENRMWDILHEKPPSRFAKLKRWSDKLRFWRRWTR